MSGIYFYDDLKLPSKNPFTDDGKYNVNWVMLRITDDVNCNMKTCKGKIFEFYVSKYHEGYEYRVNDYLNYHKLYNKNIIITGGDIEYNIVLKQMEEVQLDDCVKRVYEPEFLVHSTSNSSYMKIRECGYIKSWNLLKNESLINEDKPIGSHLGDPVDFSDYVMLGTGISCEIVVSSKQKGYICMDQDAIYEPGARIYFDVQKLIDAQLLVRDGCHYKVKEKLSIKYASFIATLKNISIRGKDITPYNFYKLADEEYNRQLK